MLTAVAAAGSCRSGHKLGYKTVGLLNKHRVQILDTRIAVKSFKKWSNNNIANENGALCVSARRVTRNSGL